MRVAGLIEGGTIRTPQRVLATTFTNRAKDNLRERLRDHVSYPVQRDHVTVANFHGLAARIIRSHGAVIGIDPMIEMPEGDWVTDRCFEMGLNWAAKDAVADAFREIKQQALDDVAVASALTARGNVAAIQIEQDRVAQSRATYDDLLRYAELILGNYAVARLYQNHFGAVIVDEYQDLTPQHLRVLRLLAKGRITFAGDLAQGIYSFAGAMPDDIDVAVRSECDDVIEFNESHRSSPSVLRLVNAMNPLTGGQDLVCADPGSWPAGGLSGLVAFGDSDAEADWVIKVSSAILRRAPHHRIGLMSRIKSRLRFIDEKLVANNVEVHRWEDGVLDTETAKILRSTLPRMNLADLAAAPDKLTYIRDLAGMAGIDEPDTRRSLADALNWVLERLGDGLTPAEVGQRIRVGDQTTLLNASGMHLLSGHVGKGQQFDWVFIVGAEDGNMPFFRARSDAEKSEEARTLGVMLSRARHGVVVTAGRIVPTADGAMRERTISPYWPVLAGAAPHDRAGTVEWLKAAPWEDLAKR